MNKKILLAFSAAILVLAACGDDVTQINEIHRDGIAVLEKGETLSEQACDTTNVGEMLFVMDSSEAFVCDGESWQMLKGKKGKDGKDGSDGKDGAKGEKGDTGSKGDSGADGEDGAPGKQGDPGKAGENGTGCTAKSVTGEAGLNGLEVICGKTVIDTVWSGKKGESGDFGMSAFEIAKENGFEGTEAEWLESLESLYLRDDRDGKIYKTVKICNEDKSTCQTWMAENLNYDPGDVSGFGKYAWSGCYGYGGGKLTDEEVLENCSKYGRLYTWEVAMDNADCKYEKMCLAPCNPETPVRGICPEGSHLPSNNEFKELLRHIDPSFYSDYEDGESMVAGKYLKSANGWEDVYTHSKGNGLDAYGFTALPGGYNSRTDSKYFDPDVFMDISEHAYFWSSSESDGSYAFLLKLNKSNDYANLSMFGSKDDAYSVRCIKD